MQNNITQQEGIQRSSFFEELGLIILEQMNEFIEFQYADRELTTDEVEQLTDWVAENISWFVQDAVHDVLEDKK